MSFLRSEEGDWPSISSRSLDIRNALAFRTSGLHSGAARNGAKGPLLEDANIRETLRRIVSGFSADPILQQDMLQECMICLWHAERKKPGRTTSWYLQHCRFHVQHWLVLGRSLDSPKRSSAANRITIDPSDDEPALQEYHTNGEVLDTVCARDLVFTLARHLNPTERVVLGCLAEGMVLREVACRSRLSYPTALKYRRKIAALTVKLGIGAPQSPSKRTRSGRSKRTITRKAR
jgi:hypothetical protein